MKIRKATTKDLVGIYEVMKKVNYISFVYKDKPKKEILKDLKKKFKERTFIILLDKQKIIGYSIIAPMKDEFKSVCKIRLKRKGYLHGMGIGIDPKYHGKGLGKKLKEKTMYIGRKLGYKGFYTATSSKNIRSQNLQKACGFKKICQYNDPGRGPGIKTFVFLKEFE